jgi:LysR substrate binding domain-containing protein
VNRRRPLPSVARQEGCSRSARRRSPRRLPSRRLRGSFEVPIPAGLGGGHINRRPRRHDVGRLASHPLLLLECGNSIRRLFNAACRLADVEPHILLESRAPHTLLALAEAGQGVTIIPSLRRTDLYRLMIVRVAHRRKPRRERFAIQWDKRRPMPPYAASFCAAQPSICARCSRSHGCPEARRPARATIATAAVGKPQAIENGLWSMPPLGHSRHFGHLVGASGQPPTPEYGSLRGHRRTCQVRTLSSTLGKVSPDPFRSFSVTCYLTRVDPKRSC